MAEETDFYALLGVNKGATDAEIKKAYRKVARELHPDVNPGDAEAEKRFKQVTLAYEVLKDPDSRARYDQFGINGIRGAGAGGGGQDPFGFGDGMNLGDIFDAFFGGAGGFGGSQGRRSQAGPPRGPDIEATIVLDLEQAIFGAHIDTDVRIPVPCDTCAASGAAPGTQPKTCTQCDGAGEVRRVRQSILGQMVTASPCGRCSGSGIEIETPCPTCRGEGRVTQERNYTVEVPAGIDRGQTLRLNGKGGAGAHGGPAGDLYVHVDVRAHDRFIRRNFDLLNEMHITVAQAALGAVIQLKTFNDEVDVHIEPGTQTGKTFNYRGKGVPHINGRGHGDLVVQIFVDTPTKLTDEQEALLRQFAALRGEDVADHDHGLLGKIKDAFR